MHDQSVRLTFPAKPDYLLLARLALGGLARGLQIDDEVLADLKLALTEACGNAVRHAYSAGEGSVRVAFLFDDGRLEMIVEDQGAGMETPLSLDDESPFGGDVPIEGGMGMAIIRAIVDELDVRAGPDERGTVVHMTKYLAAAPR
ncbi:MAG: ATP-binding protein [Gaiellaceae bacterium]